MTVNFALSLLATWVVLGSGFFYIWAVINEDSDYPRKWKTVVAIIIGGPFVWLLAILKQ